MARLLWVAVGAAAAVAGARRLGLIGVPEAGTTGAAGVGGGAAAGARAAFRTMSSAAGAARALADARREFSVGMAEREQQLRDDLLGDVDVDALRAARAERRAAAEAEEDAAEDARERARTDRARRGWADEPTEDPDDGEGDLPYAFY
jgi:hypothetical protein